MEKAAALFHSFLFNHAFVVDGNKRTSLTCTARFLSLNGYKLSAEQKEIVDFPLFVDKSHPDIETPASWFKTHGKKTHK